MLYYDEEPKKIPSGPFPIIHKVSRRALVCASDNFTPFVERYP
jgi:hypothetical protein